MGREVMGRQKKLHLRDTTRSDLEVEQSEPYLNMFFQRVPILHFFVFVHHFACVACLRSVQLITQTRRTSMFT